MAYYTIIILPPFNFSVCRPQGGEIKLLYETEQRPIFSSADPTINHIHSFNMSKTEHAGPHKEAGEKKHGWWASDIIVTPVCAFVSVHFPVCAHERLYLICFQEHLVRGIEMQVSTRRKVCLCEHRRMFYSMLPGTLNDFFFSLSGRSWEELKQLQSYKPKGQKETRCDKLLNSCHSVLHPFCLSLASALLWQKKQQKNSLQQPSFYNLGESLTTAISHDKVFN